MYVAHMRFGPFSLDSTALELAWVLIAFAIVLVIALVIGIVVRRRNARRTQETDYLIDAWRADDRAPAPDVVRSEQGSESDPTR